MKNLSMIGLAAGLFLFVSCKKDVDVPAAGLSSGISAEQLKDSIGIYAKDIYLWYKQIPSSFNVRSYNDPSAIMTSLRQYSTEPGFSTPVDRWSFAIKRGEWDKISSGISGDFGLGVFFRSPDDLRVKAVEKTSPAGRAGVRRGWRIIKINGSSAMNTGNADYIVNAVYNTPQAQFQFQKPDGSFVDLALTAAIYQEHPIMLDSVYTINGRMVGYMVFNSFLGDTSEIYQEFNTVFSRFAQQGVKDLIIDLRYNGGGYVSVQEKLANHLAPASANGNIMMKQEFNDKYTQFNSTSYFRKAGALDPARIFFIVGSGTASASELLINNLKPYLDVKLVGKETYGKPVGYFPIPVSDWYIFPVSFRTTNKNGGGSYFNGIPVHSDAADGLDKDWGDTGEASLADALYFISGGTFGRAQRDRNVIPSPEVIRGNVVLDEPSFKGAVDTRGM